MTYYNQGYGYLQPNNYAYPYPSTQEWMLIQYISHLIKLTYRVQGTMKPYYVHTPTSYIYDTPYLNSVPLGFYSMSSGVLNWYNAGNNYYPYGSGYRSLPVQTPYSDAALAMQGRYPTTYAVTNDMAYPYIGYGGYGQRGIPGY